MAIISLEYSNKEMYLLMNDLKFLVSFGDIISLVALFGLIITIILSYKAIMQSRRASILEFLPVLSVKIRGEGVAGDRYKLEIKNIGNGIAYNISIKRLIFFENFGLYDAGRPTKSWLEFDDLDVLEKGSALPLATRQRSTQTQVDNSELMIYVLTTSKQLHTLRIKYFDASGTAYLAKIIIKEGFFIVSRPPVVLTPTRQILLIIKSFILRITDELKYIHLQAKYLLLRGK